MEEGNNYILNRAKIHGKVLEVGAGDGSRKSKLLSAYSKINDYIATDYSTWDEEFESVNNLVGKFPRIGEIIFGYKKRIALDNICSATKLPFPKESFDFHLSFEVLEHIDDPIKYYSEAFRVLKKGGYSIISVPFLFRMHGGEPDHKMDFHRYLNGFFYNIAKQNNVGVVEIYSNTGAGTTIACIVNQWLIRRISESNLFIKSVLFLISPCIFFIMNLLGYLVDIRPDKRFANRFHVAIKK